ncbi:MAG: trans-sulfuration enzyme family protein [Thermoprotei archaeon]
MEEKLGLGSIATKNYLNSQAKSLLPPIYQSAVFPYPDDDAMLLHGHPLRYSREDNPTVFALEQVLKALETDDPRAEAFAFSSGMSAISTLFFSKLKPGDKLLISSEIYGLSLALARNLEIYGIHVQTAKGDELNSLVDKKTTLVFAEVISNPTLNIIDVPELSKACVENDVTLALDDTFTTPVNFRPLDYGAKVSVSSATKFLAGHNDVVAGSLAGFELNNAWDWKRMLGGSLDPHAAYLVLRGIKTLKVRLEAEEKTALVIAKALEDNKKIKRVLYPGLESHPSHKIARKLLRGYGAIVSFEINGKADDAIRFMKKLKVIRAAPSLGGTETLAMHPASAFGGAMKESDLQNAGITPSLIRLSLGLEEADDLIRDIEQALGQ